MQFTDSDFPGLFRLSDQISLKSQKSYTFLFKTELVFLVMGSIIGSFSFESNIYGKQVAFVAAMIFIMGLVITIYIKMQKFEDKWYVGRAIAESVKSISWRYMTKGEPYLDSVPDDEINKEFRSTLREILKENKGFLDETISDANNDAITIKMQEIRNYSFSERLSFYLENRVKDQLEWYRKKSTFNKSKTDFYYLVIIVLYVLVIGYHIYLVFDNSFFNAAPIIATIVGCFLSWTKMKQYQELSKSYAVTAHEISLILDEGKDVKTEEDLQVFVGDSEAAFSREHTLWLARRDVF